MALTVRAWDGKMSLLRKQLESANLPVVRVDCQQDIMTNTIKVAVLFTNQLRLQFTLFSDTLESPMESWADLANRIGEAYDNELEKELERLEEKAEKEKDPEPVKVKGPLEEYTELKEKRVNDTIKFRKPVIPKFSTPESVAEDVMNAKKIMDILSEKDWNYTHKRR